MRSATAPVTPQQITTQDSSAASCAADPTHGPVASPAHSSGLEAQTPNTCPTCSKSTDCDDPRCLGCCDCPDNLCLASFVEPDDSPDFEYDPQNDNVDFVRLAAPHCRACGVTLLEREQNDATCDTAECRRLAAAGISPKCRVCGECLPAREFALQAHSTDCSELSDLVAPLAREVA